METILMMKGHICIWSFICFTLPWYEEHSENNWEIQTICGYFFREWTESFLCSSHCHVYNRNRQHSWILIATWKCNDSLGIYRKLGIYNSGHCMRFFLPLYFYFKKIKKCAPSYGLLVIIKDIKHEVLNWERKNCP